MKFRILLALFLISVMVLTSCKSEDKTAKDDKQPEKHKEEKGYVEISRLEIKNRKENYIVGDKIELGLVKPDSVMVDSMLVFAQGNLQEKCTEENLFATFLTDDWPVGTSQIKVVAYLDNGHKEFHYKNVVLLSDIIPVKLTCKIENSYKHLDKAYTQGLFYEDGYLYEGTGQRGESSLFKIKPEDGELVESLSLPNQYFGEGITSFGNKIIQLTWTSRTGFVYDKKEFKLINKVRYPTQGWGLTTDGEKLIMSDGTANIYFLDPEFFTETGRLEIYDNKGPVKNLNELEYFNNKVYANVWQESYIISFDPETGKVLEKIDCSKLVPEKFKNHKDNVLNGIAYDEKEKRIFLTGKRWPRIYQVEFVKK